MIINTVHNTTINKETSEINKFKTHGWMQLSSKEDLETTDLSIIDTLYDMTIPIRKNYDAILDTNKKLNDEYFDSRMSEFLTTVSLVTSVFGNLDALSKTSSAVLNTISGGTAFADIVCDASSGNNFAKLILALYDVKNLSYNLEKFETSVIKLKNIYTSTNYEDMYKIHENTAYIECIINISDSLTIISSIFKSNHIPFNEYRINRLLQYLNQAKWGSSYLKGVYDGY